MHLGYATKSTGELIASYIKSAVTGIQTFLEKYGDDGRDELNQVSAPHIIAMAPATDSRIGYSGVEISSNNTLKTNIG
ncbi:MAG: hypothetical protein L6R40_007461 [Gallowayella cf. fulva]|nr:MAG: hypothetical protein L6R40_007461 [Xanthomendoza cf. fulva]